MKKLNKVLVGTMVAFFVFGLFGSAQAATAVTLGTAGSFAVLAGAGITNTGSTTITGDVGTFPTPSEVGFGSITLDGTNNADNAVTQGAKDNLVTGYNNVAGQTPVTTIETELGGSTRSAGVYDSADGTFGITGTLTLDGDGDSGSVFIFKMASTLITASNSKVVLVNNAQACNVFWQVGSSATLGTGTTFRGSILALSDITLTTGATVDGQVLARNGAVTMDTNTVTRAVCLVETPPVTDAAVITPSPTSTPTASMASSGSSVVFPAFPDAGNEVPGGDAAKEILVAISIVALTLIFYIFLRRNQLASLVAKNN